MTDLAQRENIPYDFWEFFCIGDTIHKHWEVLVVSHICIIFFFFIHAKSKCLFNPMVGTQMGGFCLLGELAGRRSVTNRLPSIAGAVLQTPSLFINKATDSSFFSQSSKHHYSQTVTNRELKIWVNVHPPPYVTCHMSCVKCHVSHVTYHVSHVMYHV